jgi:type I restriction enzyme S subunit
MNPDLLLKQFDRISDAPGAIQRLRRFVLDLAVRGKLVEQDRRDEPASEFLARIQRVGLVGERKTSKEKSLQAINAIESPYSIPHSW